MPISSNILKEKALEFAKRFGSDNFKASTGWLDKWKQRHGVCRKKVCDENNAVRGEVCNNWTTGVLPHLLEKCNELDIFIADETGLFYKCLPNKTLTSKNEQCHGGKHAVESDDEVSVEVCIQQPSKNDVVDSLRYLNLYLQSNDNTTEDHYEALNKLEAFFAENIQKK
ncbi:cag [Carabus blaptoides fortunei]